MLNLESKEERIKLGNHGKYKGEEYPKLPNTLIFIESSEHQALVIANIKERKVRNLIRRYIPLEFRKKIKKIVKR